MDKKNIFDKNKFDRKKVVYYIMMAVCVIAVGTISFLSYKSAQNSISEQRIENKTDNIDKVDSKVENISHITPETETSQEQTSVEPEEQVETVEKNETPEIKAKEYIMPTKGDIKVNFSLTTPVYSETLKDWRIHDGIDIAANMGDNVVAVNDGAVEKIKADDLFGITVVIKHTDGKKSIYCNLDDSVELEEGQIISRGDIVGKIGQSAIFEISDGPHLHFEMSENGKKIDPLSVIKVQE